MPQKIAGGRYLVTGAAGMLGSFIVDELAAAGASVVAVDVASPRPGYGHAPSDSVTDLTFDILDTDSMVDAMSGCDGIVHVAAMLTRAMRERPGPGLQVNVVATHNLFEAAVNAGVGRVVLASSGAVYNRTTVSGRGIRETDPTPGRSFYAASKVASELYAEVFAQERGLSYIACRLGTLYGPRISPDTTLVRYLNAVLDGLKAGRPVELPLDPKDSRDLVYVADAARCFVAALVSEQVNTTINIANGTLTTNEELFDALVRATGSDTTVTWKAPDAEVVPHGRYFDMTHTEEVLGYRPDTDLEDGLRQFVEWRLRHVS